MDNKDEDKVMRLHVLFNINQLYTPCEDIAASRSSAPTRNGTWCQGIAISNSSLTPARDHVLHERIGSSPSVMKKPENIAQSSIGLS